MLAKSRNRNFAMERIFGFLMHPKTKELQMIPSKAPKPTRRQSFCNINPPSVSSLRTPHTISTMDTITATQPPFKNPIATALCFCFRIFNCHSVQPPKNRMLQYATTAIYFKIIVRLIASSHASSNNTNANRNDTKHSTYPKALFEVRFGSFSLLVAFGIEVSHTEMAQCNSKHT